VPEEGTPVESDTPGEVDEADDNVEFVPSVSDAVVVITDEFALRYQD
jgi:hypothetical protein